MRILTNASCLFFGSNYAHCGLAVFNEVDAATGAPSVPATGAPQESAQSSEGGTTLDSLKFPIDDIQEHISTLQQMGATQDADQQQSALEGKLNEFKKSLDALSDTCQGLIIKYRQEGVPNLDANAQPQAGSTGQAPGMDMGMGGMGTDPSMDMGMGALPTGGDPMAGMAPPPPMPGAASAPGAGMTPAAPAGASVPGMTTYDDLTQQNQTGVVGQGGSTMPQM